MNIDTRSSHVACFDTTAEDVMRIVPFLRAEDRSEWAAAGVTNMTELLLAAAEMPRVDPRFRTRTITVGKRPMVIFGVSPHHSVPRAGQVWLVAAEAAASYAITIHRHSMNEIDDMRELGYETLHADTWEGNAAHHRWLEWCGFWLLDRFFAGPHSATFLHYEKPLTGEL